MNPFSLSVTDLEKPREPSVDIIVLNANSPAGGHTGADLSQVEILTALYFRVMNCSPSWLTAMRGTSTSSQKAMRLAVITACWPKQVSSRQSGCRPISTPIRICRGIR